MRLTVAAVFDPVEDAIRTSVRHGLSDSTDPHLDAWILWAGLNGVATLRKPRRTDLLRLGRLGRPAVLQAMTRRQARLSAPG